MRCSRRATFNSTSNIRRCSDIKHYSMGNTTSTCSSLLHVWKCGNEIVKDPLLEKLIWDKSSETDTLIADVSSNIATYGGAIWQYPMSPKGTRFLTATTQIWAYLLYIKYPIYIQATWWRTEARGLDHDQSQHQQRYVWSVRTEDTGTSTLFVGCETSERRPRQPRSRLHTDTALGSRQSTFSIAWEADTARLSNANVKSHADIEA